VGHSFASCVVQLRAINRQLVRVDTRRARCSEPVHLDIGEHRAGRPAERILGLTARSGEPRIRAVHLNAQIGGDAPGSKVRTGGHDAPRSEAKSADYRLRWSAQCQEPVDVRR
jgi:hypothetical protein